MTATAIIAARSASINAMRLQQKNDTSHANVAAAAGAGRRPSSSIAPGVKRLPLGDEDLSGACLLGPQLQSVQQWEALAQRVKTIVKLTEEPYPDAVKDFLRSKKVTILAFPIAEYAAPPHHGDVDKLVDSILKRLHKGENVYVHCRDGKGRTGIIAACIAARVRNLPGRQAIQYMQTVLPAAAQSGEQQAFVAKFAGTHCVRPTLRKGSLQALG
mmetsp:Transcript_22766/g.61685  ORF Transcript_22766/g.61685 Transcript_22766/m.61685 type:complete len:215 (-) Transcript_22766:578-1222(-)